MRVAVIGASGYSGLEIVRILLRHPHAKLSVVTSEQRAGQPIGEAFPGLRGLCDLRLESSQDLASIAERADAAFCALPHGASAPTVARLREAGLTVLDVSADFRLRDAEVYRQWYGEHKAPELFGQAVYGLPEVYGAQLPGAKLIACPGCYPTSALLPMLPLLREELVQPAPIFVDAKSGVSGAGRSLSEDYLFAELDANAHAYKVGQHRHGPEIEQEASVAAGSAAQVTFVPQLIPTTRGILTSVMLQGRGAGTGPGAAEALQGALERAYADAPFVRVVPQGETPRLASVRGTNFCDVGVVSDPRGTVVALAAIDNLVKGAGGQGVQALNLSQGWPETAGLLEAPALP